MEVRVRKSLAALSCLTFLCAIAHAGEPKANLPDQDQVTTLRSKVENNVMVPKAAKQLWADAAPTIEKITLYLSCIPDFTLAGDPLKKYVVPENTTSTWYVFKFGVMDRGAYGGFKYHPKSKCVSVSRVDDIKQVAKNALEYRVTYESDVSGETYIANYAMVRQPDGVWLYTFPK